MKSLLSAVSCMLALGIAATAAHAQSTGDHKILTPDDVKWSAGPPSIPKGAEMAVLYGDPSKEGSFALRLKMPKGYQIAPHSHPKPEIVTVLSGTFRIGMDETADPSKAQALPAGGFFAFPPGITHFASTDEDTVIQLNSTGPWALNYVNPKDDPRQKTQ
jgi:quercetin dioxygenase-like cupin family protein